MREGDVYSQSKASRGHHGWYRFAGGDGVLLTSRQTSVSSLRTLHRAVFKRGDRVWMFTQHKDFKLPMESYL